MATHMCHMVETYALGLASEIMECVFTVDGLDTTGVKVHLGAKCMNLSLPQDKGDHDNHDSFGKIYTLYEHLILEPI